jgi:uncharacterized membrane protein YqaE (UPF0057 family)
MKKNLLLFATCVVMLISPFIVSAASIVTSSVVPVAANPSDVLKKAIADYKTLSRSEKKAKIKDVKKAIHEYKAAKKTAAEPSTNTLLLVILAIILPPLAVYLHEGEINNKFWLDLILTLLFFIPGVIYALIVVLGKS